MSNRPSEMKLFDRLHAEIGIAANSGLYTGIAAAHKSASEISALVYLMWQEGSKPSCQKFFLEEISGTKGNTVVKRLVNYVLDDVPGELKGVAVQYCNHIVAAVEILGLGAHHKSDKAALLKEIEHLGGLDVLRIRWNTLVIERKRREIEEHKIRVQEHKARQLENQAAAAGLTTAAYEKQIRESEQERLNTARNSRLGMIIREGSVVKAKGLPVSTGCVIIEHNGKMIQLSDEWSAEIRAILTMGSENPVNLKVSG